MFRLLAWCLCWMLFTVPLLAAPAPLQSFTVQDYLQHQWTDELVHFAINYPGKLPGALTLVDTTGKPVPCQISGLTRKDGNVTGTVWTVVSVPPAGKVTLHLQPGRPAQSTLRLRTQEKEYVLGNDKIVLRLPRLTSALKQPVDLAAVPAPLLSLAIAGNGNWLGAGAWVNPDKPLQVKDARTTVLEEGPVRVTVRYRLTLTDNRFYQADITLGARQDAALFTDETDVEAPNALFRFSFQPGLNADHLFWKNNNWRKPWDGLPGTSLAVDGEKVICSLCPWSFWWLEDRTTWAGFYRDDADPFLGVLALRPSRWTPNGWSGFDRTIIPITARPGGQVDISLGLLALTQKKPDGATELVKAHRELAFTAGPATDFLEKQKMPILAEAEVARQRSDVGTWNRLLREGLWLFKLRRQLVQYSEFPLDEVKDFSFDYHSSTRARKHPYLLVTQTDIDRARQQAKSVPVFKQALAASQRSIGDPVAKITNGPDGWKKFYQENYVGNYLFGSAPLAFVGSDDKKYGITLAAGVKGLAASVVDQFLRNPSSSSLGGNGHMAATNMLGLLLAYDVLADSPYLSAEDKASIDAVLVFGGYVFDHPDYWNGEVGLCSANPNMTSLLKLPLGLVGLYLDGHPRANHWLAFAEQELQRELRDWSAPGGAWIECPYYQSSSLDGMFMLAQAIKNVRGKDYFADPQFKATMDYYGFILTPPDVRFPPTKTADSMVPMTVPSIGDAFPGFTTAFNGWMAKATAQTDPNYSARQQFYWQGQYYSILNTGRPGAFTMALCDTELPAAPPTELSRAFPGFGNILRTSWTDPKASYISHRCGHFVHHYDPGDFNSIQYFAKGAPLCIDFGHRGAGDNKVYTMWRPDYHTTVSFDRPGPEAYWKPSSGGSVEQNEQAQEVVSLPRVIDYSAGLSAGSGGQQHLRHLLLVKSADPLGANYVVMRDVTKDGQPNQQFTWNLWCMAKEPEVAGNVAHFPGVFGVDLDAHVLTPANPQFTKDSYSYEQWVSPWGKFTEAQTGVRVKKSGSLEDFFAVLYPRAADQGPAQVIALSDGRGVEVTHMEGTDVVLLSPGRVAMVKSGEVELSGQLAFARRTTAGVLCLAVVKNAAAVQFPWGLRSDGPTAISIKGTSITGESSGDAHSAIVTLPPTYGTAVVTLDGKPVTTTQAQNLLTVELPAGYHTFTINTKDER